VYVKFSGLQGLTYKGRYRRETLGGVKRLIRILDANGRQATVKAREHRLGI
jgi:hypothetical protein